MLFLLSLILVFGFAFFTANILDSKNVINNIVYVCLSAFAEIVFTFEVLSLFSEISLNHVLYFNILLFCINLFIWIIKGRPVIKINYTNVFRIFWSALKRDKILAFLLAGFLFMMIVSVFLIIIFPASEAAAVTYHVVRALFWIDHGNLNHFNIADARALTFPINSEILYMWVMLFLKKDTGLCGFSLTAFLFYIVSFYGVLSKFTVSLRRKLWCIFIVSSFTAVITYLSSTETNIILAALVMSGLYLMLEYFKKYKFTVAFMASLAFALALGVKTSAFFILPAVIIWFLVCGIHYRVQNIYKNFIIWAALLFINFLIFSSYNYILNFINYGDFVSIPSIMQSHKNIFGLKGFFFNTVNYLIMMFKLSEFDGIYNFSDLSFHILMKLVHILHQPFLIGHYTNDSTFRIISADRSGLGLNGILVFLPCLILAFKGVWSRKNNKKFLISSFSIIFLIAFLIMAYSVIYMSFNIRFIVTFALISAPVIYFSYCRRLNFYKILVALVAIISYVYVSLHITHSNVLYLINYFRQGYSVEKIRETARCSSISQIIDDKYLSAYCTIRNYIKSYDRRNKFLYFSQETDALLPIKLLQFEDYCIDVDLLEDLENIELDEYNILILLDNRQFSTMFHNVDRLEAGVYRGDGFYCVYNEVNGKMVFDPDLTAPYLSNCTLTEDFRQKRGFRFRDVLVFSENFDGIDRKFKYYIYENLNNPVIK